MVHSVWDYFLLCPRVTLTRRDGTECSPSPLLCGLRTRNLSRWAHAVSHVIGCSQHVLDVHRAFFPAAVTHVLRNPMAADDEPLRPPRERPAVAGYIGALDKTKGVDLLLEAAPELMRLGIQLRLAGDGRLRGAVIDAAQKHANVEWIGHVTGTAKRRFLVVTPFGLIPSVWAEPGGPTFTMAEWLRGGRPVTSPGAEGSGESPSSGSGS